MANARRIVKQAIPDPKSPDFNRAVKERIEIYDGSRTGRIEELPEGATVEEVAAKLNELLTRLQT